MDKWIKFREFLQRKCFSANLKYSDHVTQIFFSPVCDWTWGSGDWPFLVREDLDGLSSSEFCDFEACTAILPSVWSLSSLSYLPCCLGAFLHSPACFLSAFQSASLNTLPGWARHRIFHLRKPTWQKASSSSAECSYYDLYLIHAFHSWRKLNEVHNLRYVLRWGRNLLNHEFHYWKIWFISKLQQHIHVITTSQYLHLCVDIWI